MKQDLVEYNQEIDYDSDPELVAKNKRQLLNHFRKVVRKHMWDEFEKKEKPFISFYGISRILCGKTRSNKIKDSIESSASSEATSPKESNKVRSKCAPALGFICPNKPSEKK